MMVWIPLFALFLALAYINGANDNFKGVATIYGSAAGGYRTSLYWAGLATFLGSLVSFFLASRLLQLFTGRGILPDGRVTDPRVIGAVAAGALITLVLATIFGMPTSTTHALAGGILGAGVALHPAVPSWKFFQSILIPLLLSPFLAMGVTAALYAIFRKIQTAGGFKRETCICISRVQTAPAVAGKSPAVHAASAVPVAYVDSVHRCRARYAGNFMGVSVQTLMEAGHFFSAFAVSFSRGLNDTPKIAALLFTLTLAGMRASTLLVGAAMLLGGLLSARRVAETLSHRITPMTPGQGFTANLATSLVVLAASAFGVPVSTTHVSVGALFGLGMVRGSTRRRSAAAILLTWAVTLPAAAVLSGLLLRFLPAAPP